jgi:PcfJ-like protein
LRIAKSKLVKNYSNYSTAAGTLSFPFDFTRQAVRFFCAHPDVKIVMINDLCDYFDHMREGEPDYPVSGGYSLKGRTIGSLKRGMEDWHRGLARERTLLRLGKPAWEGYDVPLFQHYDKDTKKRWEIVQILTAKELSAEGSAQHHCVTSYAPKCSRGDCAIFSLRQVQGALAYRKVTIEVNRAGDIVQTKRFANAAPDSEEKSIIKQWARSNSLRY